MEKLQHSLGCHLLFQKPVGWGAESRTPTDLILTAYSEDRPSIVKVWITPLIQKIEREEEGDAAADSNSISVGKTALSKMTRKDE